MNDSIQHEIIDLDSQNTSNGYIYILVNSSMEGLIKIGKTKRNPEERAFELSNSTGVPTPFIVAYKEIFSDCDYMEKYIHNLLEHMNYRYANNREFFTAPIKEVIDLILQLKLADKNHITPVFDETDVKNTFPKYVDRENKIAELIREGDAYLHGHDDYFIDEKRAVSCFLKASKLGSVKAFLALGKYYCKQWSVSHRPSQMDKGLDFLIQGHELQSGYDSIECLVEYATNSRLKSLYEKSKGRDTYNISVMNAKKAWEQLFIEHLGLKDYSVPPLNAKDYVLLHLENYFTIDEEILRQLSYICCEIFYNNYTLKKFLSLNEQYSNEYSQVKNLLKRHYGSKNFFKHYKENVLYIFKKEDNSYGLHVKSRYTNLLAQNDIIRITYNNSFKESHLFLVDSLNTINKTLEITVTPWTNAQEDFLSKILSSYNPNIEIVIEKAGVDSSCLKKSQNHYLGCLFLIAFFIFIVIKLSTL